MTQYSMTPIASGTRVRSDHNTFAPTITSYGITATVYGDEIWEAPADGSEVKKGDQWLHVTHVVVDGKETAILGWMAYIHKGVPICNNFTVIDGEVPPPPPPPPVELSTYYNVTVSEALKLVSVTLTDKNGAKIPLTGWSIRLEE